MKQPKIKVCERCGKEFEARSASQKYCGKTCAAWVQCYKASEAARLKREKRKQDEPTRYCARCGGELPYGSNGNKKYCGACRRSIDRECARVSNERRKQEGYHRRELRSFTCTMCGSQAQAYGHAKYCDACKKRKQRNTQIAFLGKRDGREVYEQKCAKCGLPFNTFSKERGVCTVCVKAVNDTDLETAPPPVPLTLAEQMREIDEYNREHGTRLSYGKYMAMIRAKEGETRVVVKL